MTIYALAFQVTQSCAVTRDTAVAKDCTIFILNVKGNNGGSAVSETTVTAASETTVTAVSETTVTSY